MNFMSFGTAYQIHGSLARYVKLRAAHAPGMSETFSLPSRVNDPDLHHGTCGMVYSIYITFIYVNCCVCMLMVSLQPV